MTSSTNDFTPETNTDPFTLLIRVRYGECDAQQVVFNARYGDYVDLAATEFMRACIGGYQALLESGYDNQVVRLLTEWQAPARFDDVLALQVSVGHLGNTSFRLDVHIANQNSGQTVATSEVTYVLLDAKTFEKTPIPLNLKQRLEQGGKGLVADQSHVAGAL